MRRLTPWLGQILAVLLLMQWGGSLSACLGTMRWDPSQVLCHAPEPTPDQDQTGTAASGCPLCAPLPPSLLPVLPDFPPPRPVVTRLGKLSASPVGAQAARQLTPQQPRAPPHLS